MFRSAEIQSKYNHRRQVQELLDSWVILGNLCSILSTLVGGGEGAMEKGIIHVKGIKYSPRGSQSVVSVLACLASVLKALDLCPVVWKASYVNQGLNCKEGLNFSGLKHPLEPCSRPFPSSPKSLFQNESKCEIVVMVISSNFNYEWKLIFITKTSHLASLWNGGWGEFGNGLFKVDRK